MSDSITAFDSRYNFTCQLLAAAASQSRLAFDLESRISWPPDRADEIAHRGFATGAVLQSVAALESELWCVVHWGPGHHLGGDATDKDAREFLLPISEMLDSGPVTGRYDAVLHLLKRTEIDRGSSLWEQTQLLVKLRNELVHYKSRMASELELTKLIAALRAQPIAGPTFMPDNIAGWFPHVCLSAPRAAWATETAIAFLDDFYNRLGLASPLVPWRADLIARPSTGSALMSASSGCRER
ncbi:MAG: hypothetical protein P4L93_08230 [Coriobacteriia bacterium]|nr:hypothetical protein [Coriobacteriia bacterium]